MRRSFCDFIDGVTSETMPEQRAARVEVLQAGRTWANEGQAASVRPAFGATGSWHMSL